MSDDRISCPIWATIYPGSFYVLIINHDYSRILRLDYSCTIRECSASSKTTNDYKAIIYSDGTKRNKKKQLSAENNGTYDELAFVPALRCGNTLPSSRMGGVPAPRHYIQLYSLFIEQQPHKKTSTTIK